MSQCASGEPMVYFVAQQTGRRTGTACQVGPRLGRLPATMGQTLASPMLWPVERVGTNQLTFRH